MGVVLGMHEDGEERRALYEPEQTGQVDGLALAELRPITRSLPSVEEKLSRSATRKLSPVRALQNSLTMTSTADASDSLRTFTDRMQAYEGCVKQWQSTYTCDSLLSDMLSELERYHIVMDDKVRTFFKCDDSLAAILHEAICSLENSLTPSLFPAECPSDVPAKEILMLWGLGYGQKVRTTSFGGAKTALYEHKGVPAATRLDTMMNGAAEYIASI